MKKSLFQRALSVRNGVLESRLVARSDDLNRDLTDSETIEELKYLKETLPYSGHDVKEHIIAINYLLNRYGGGIK